MLRLNRTVLTAATLIVTLGFNLEAKAETVGFDVRITPYRGGGTNSQNLGFPYIDLTNTAESLDLVDYSVTLGNSDYFFDYSAVNASSNISSADSTLVTPELLLNNQGTAAVRYTFAPGIFTPGETFSHRSDIDRVSETGAEETYTVDQPDFREVLFTLNGTDESLNAVITARFADGSELSGRLPNFEPTLNNYYSTGFSAVVPEPGSLALIGLGCGLLIARRRRSA